jgi:hypothetical protein
MIISSLVLVVEFFCAFRKGIWLGMGMHVPRGIGMAFFLLRVIINNDERYC